MFPSIRRAFLFAVLLAPAACPAELRLPHTLGSHMVVQRDQPIHIWGWATPGSSVTVTLDRDHASATADELGRWSVYLSARPAGAAFSIDIAGDGRRLMVEDILAGDLWIASGQSNMEMPLRGFGPANPVRNGEATAASATDPEIRLLHLAQASSPYPLEDVSATWERSSPAVAREFSAVGFFFAQELRSSEKVPIGLIDSTWGGTPAEAWVSAPALAADPNLLPVYQAYSRFMDEQTRLAATLEKEHREDRQAASSGAPAPSHPWHPNPVSWQPSGLFNAMIAPLTPLPIRGVIWYQGETNSGLDRAPLYARLFPALIADWRTQWKQGDFPFLFAQISSFRSTPFEAWGVLRDAQRRTLSVRDTGMAVTMDVGNPDNVHPADKQTVAHRLALLAEELSYAHPPAQPAPSFLGATIEGQSIRLHFGPAALVCRSPCGGFEIAGADHHFVPAQVHIQAATVLVSADAIKQPAFVRYAWSNAPTVSLFSQAGLPASTFTTEDDLSGQQLRPTSYGQTEDATH